jgi:hypothetical protein
MNIEARMSSTARILTNIDPTPISDFSDLLPQRREGAKFELECIPLRLAAFA